MTNNNSRNSNLPDGFRGFQNRVDALTDALGGSAAVRIIIENAFNGSLRTIVCSRLYGNTWGAGSRYGTLWIAANDLDFEAAALEAERKFTKLAADVIESWDSSSLNGQIVLKGARVYLERSEHAIMLAMAYADDHARERIHPAQTTRNDPWRIFLSDFGEIITKLLGTQPPNVSTTAQSVTGAQKSLRRFAKLFI